MSIVINGVNTFDNSSKKKKEKLPFKLNDLLRLVVA